VPVLAVLVGLDWYFKKTRAIYIAVAGVVSAVFYSHLVWNEPSPSLILTNIGWYLGLSVLAVAIYFGLYAAYREQKVPWWILTVVLVSYVGLYCALAIFCAAVLAGHEYWLLGGRVLANSQPLAGATLTLQDERDSIIKVRTTDERGRFLLPLKYEELKTKPDAEKPARLLVKAKGYDDEPRELDSFPNIHLTVSLQKNTSHP